MTVFAFALASAGVRTACADGQKKEKTFTGIVSAVDGKEKVFRVHKYFFNRTFIMGKDCALIGGDNESTGLADFRPGQQVEVTFRDASGVLVASRIAQEKMMFKGKVQKIDAANHTLTVHHRGSTRTFRLPEHSTLVLAGDRRSEIENGKGLMEHVRPGNEVTIVYEVPDDQYVAREVDQTSRVFVGTLHNIDLMDNSISAAESPGKDERFHLADGCSIMVNNKPEGRLKELRLGQKYDLSYVDVDGVKVVNRIAPAGMEHEAAMSPQASR